MPTDELESTKLKTGVFDPQKKLGEEMPGAPFAVVGLTYVALLGIVAIGFGLFLWLVR